MSNNNPEEVVDRLSELSEPLLLQIISFLPFKFAVRTSIIARRFRHLYKATSSLELDRSEFPDGCLFNGVTSRYLRLRDPSALLRSFSLKAWIGRPFSINLLKKWLNCADSLGMRHLSLHLQTATIETIFPFVRSYHLYGFQSFQSLVIDDVDIDYIFGGYKFEPLIPPSFSQTQLKYLRIKAKMSPSDLRLLILGLSNLEYLSIQPTRRCEVDMSSLSVKILKITSDTFAQPHRKISLSFPSLEFLDLSIGISREMKQFHLEMPILKSAAVTIRSLHEEYVPVLCDILRALSNVPELTLHIGTPYPKRLVGPARKRKQDRPSDHKEKCWAPEVWHSKLPRNSEGNRKYADFTNLKTGDKKSEAIELLSTENPSKRLKMW